jgi:hypothetical protein
MSHHASRTAHRTPARLAALALGALGALTNLPAPAHADEFVDRANLPYSQVPESRRSDLVILPLAAKMKPAPAGLAPERPESYTAAALLAPGAPQWAEAVAWAQGPEQRAVLEALGRVTQETDWRRAMVFAQPYGVDGVPLELIRAGLFTDLGDPPMLLGAIPAALDALRAISLLAQVEASRLVAEGKHADAADLMATWVLFARQSADRQKGEEASWAMGEMARGFVRLRDVVHADFADKRTIPLERITAIIERLEPERADLLLNRVTFPQGDRAAAEQLIARVLDDGGAREGVFDAEIARLRSTRFPLRAFPEAAGASIAGALAPPRARAEESLRAVFDSWSNRWPVDYFDPRMSQPFTYSTLSPVEGMVVRAAVPSDLAGLFGDRQRVRVEALGTRAALALVAFVYDTRNLPPSLASVGGKYIRGLPVDPFNRAGRDRGGTPPFQYFVPGRDTPANQLRDGKYDVQVFVAGAGGVENSFVVPLDSDTFVLYSVGPDLAVNGARRVQNAVSEAPGADYIIWPPVISLQRQNLVDTGALSGR